MGTTSDKLTYLNGTKQALKDSINNIGGSITDETTFRAYAEELDNIYSSLPKTTGEGSNLSLTTLKGRINVDDILGDTKQDKTNGYQLFDISLLSGQSGTSIGVTRTIESEDIILNGTTNGSGAILSSNNLNKELASGTYTWTVTIKSGTASKESSSVDATFILYDTNNTILAQKPLGQILANNFSSQFTLSEAKTIGRFYIYANNSGVTFTNCKFQFMLESGTTAHTWEKYTNGASPNPTYPQDINVVTGQQEVLVRGKNLFDRANASENYMMTWTGGELFADTGSITSDYVLVEEGQRYNSTYLAQIMFYDKNKEYVGCLQSGGTSVAKVTGTSFKLITIPSGYDIAYMRMGFRAQYSTGVDLLTANIQIEKGATATAYVPYQEQTKIVNLSSKNLFDKDNANIVDNAYIGSTNISAINGAKTLYIKCEPSTTYTISRTAGKRFVVATTIYEPQLNTSIGGRIVDNEASSITITTNSVAQYLCVFYYLSGVDTLTEEEIRNSIMIELGSTATTYEPYYNYELSKIGTYQDRIFETSGKNLLNIQNGSTTSNGITTTNTNGTISASGTSTATSFCTIINDTLNLKARYIYFKC